MKNILIAVPTNKYIEPETFKSIYDFIIPNNCDVQFQYFYGFQIDQIRNRIAHEGMSFDYILFIDSDIIAPRDTLVKLLSSDKDIVSGVYMKKIANCDLTELYINKSKGFEALSASQLSKNTRLFEVGACGFGCCLVNTKVFRSLEYPYFVYKSSLDPLQILSEDIFFCIYSKALGYSTWVNTEVVCKHKGITYF